MTGKELIQELQTCPEDYVVMTWMSSGNIDNTKVNSAKLEIPGIN